MESCRIIFLDGSDVLDDDSLPCCCLSLHLVEVHKNGVGFLYVRFGGVDDTTQVFHCRCSGNQLLFAVNVQFNVKLYFFCHNFNV